MTRYAELPGGASDRHRTRAALYVAALAAIVLIGASVAPSDALSRARGALRTWATRGAERHTRAPASAGSQQAAGGDTDPGDKVLLELFVMSKCPDASYCEHYLADDLERLSDIVHVRTQ